MEIWLIVKLYKIEIAVLAEKKVMAFIWIFRILIQQISVLLALFLLPAQTWSGAGILSSPISFCRDKQGRHLNHPDYDPRTLHVSFNL